jgi:enoyl-CoA hydratase/carnithine racemase
MHITDLASVIELEERTQSICSSGPDFEEALRAFTEKRPPQFATG